MTSGFISKQHLNNPRGRPQIQGPMWLLTLYVSYIGTCMNIINACLIIAGFMYFSKYSIETLPSLLSTGW